MAFKQLDPEDFLVSSEAQTGTLWSTNTANLNEFFTSSVQESSDSGDYYLSVYQTASGLPGSEVQFDIAYAQPTGGGALRFNASVTGNSPTSTVYGQYRSMILQDENSQFVFGDVTGSDFYVMTPRRARYKQELFPGTFELHISGSSNSNLQLIDNSKTTAVAQFIGTNPYYQIVSGSINNGVYTGVNSNGYTALSGSYGWFLPDIGVIMLNARALDLNNAQGINLGTIQTTNTDANNPRKLFNAISGSGVLSGSVNFQLNSKETITSDYVFIRSRNSEFNYSENPSFISGSNGSVIYSDFIDNPQVYMTTIGLYNDANELMAVAKLSKPVLKDFTKEALVRVKLDF
jgi:hypothetical protein